MTLLKDRGLKILVRRGRCGARGPGALRRRVACLPARGTSLPAYTPHPDPPESPVPADYNQTTCGDADVDAAKVAAKVVKIDKVVKVIKVVKVNHQPARARVEAHQRVRQCAVRMGMRLRPGVAPKVRSSRTSRR